MACKDPRFRQRILDEIVSTEVTYVNNLKTLKNVYLIPLRSKDSITKEDMDVIFQNWEMLLGFNKEFLDHLQEATEMGVEGCKVGALFKRFGEFASQMPRAVCIQREDLPYGTHCRLSSFPLP